VMPMFQKSTVRCPGAWLRHPNFPRIRLNPSTSQLRGFEVEAGVHRSSNNLAMILQRS
jgi:hypothetical protein